MSSVTFLGTGGGRMVVLNQLRKSGGFWLKLGEANILQDPGPGSLVMVHRLKLVPKDLDAIVLSHRHIDHSNDVNVMIESMTGGGFQPHGRLIVPSDCLNSDPVVLEYVRPFVEIIEINEGLKTTLNDIEIEFPIRTMHPVETYGVIYQWNSKRLGYIPDTEYFPKLSGAYKNIDYLIINVVRMKNDMSIRHLNITSAKKLINDIKPKLAILTHFGLQVLKASPEFQAKIITEETGITVMAAFDGMIQDLDDRESLENWV
ncbi:MAG: MBL fold metallo-hydrolase [Candidatus Methanoperedens sp.]|nr:MBL fold metallo-hydrolase [Candidatus Methanoperedens sp.]MCE8427034.1 MBL fold metallo-hydrolase [Candidatus Methanoperedens sp.]